MDKYEFLEKLKSLRDSCDDLAYADHLNDIITDIEYEIKVEEEETQTEACEMKHQHGLTWDQLGLRR